MPTTSAHAARVILEGLDAAGVEYALLHGSEAFETDTISDVDLAIASLDEETARRVVREANDRGYWLIVTWLYDVRGVVLFFVSDDFNEGVHLDLLIDPLGRSRYGLKTAEIVSKATVRNGLRQADPLDSWLYQVSKRWKKRQHTRLEQLLAESPVGESTGSARAHQLFRPDRAERISTLISGVRPRAGDPLSWHARNVARVVSRTRRPCGVWLHIGAAAKRADAELLAGRLNAVLVEATSAEIHGISFTRRLGLTGKHGIDRWRAGASVTYGAPPFLGSCTRIDEVEARSSQSDRSCAGLFRLTQLVKSDLRRGWAQHRSSRPGNTGREMETS